MPFLVLLLATLLFTLSGFSQSKARDGYALEGKITGGANKKIFLREQANYKFGLITDSLVADKAGSFMFKGILSEPALFEIEVSGTNMIHKLFVLENTHMFIDGDISSAKFTVYGSKETELWQALVKINANSESKRLEVLKSFFLENKESVAGLYAFAELSTVLRHDEILEYIKDLEQSKVRDYAFLKFFKERTFKKVQIHVGANAPDFVQPDRGGNLVSVSSFRGKYVLLDFWASWCGPCRKESPNLVKAYNSYKDKNFDILSVSLDKDERSWINAIKQDSLVWFQVSDLKGWQNVAAHKYAVESLPATFLINPSGQIIAINLRGNNLQQKLFEIFEKN